MKATGGGLYDADDRPLYFIAGAPLAAENIRTHPYSLMAANDFLGGRDGAAGKSATADILERMDAGARMLFDSGIYWLTTQHAKAHGISMDEALSIPPDEVDNFGPLWDLYVLVVGQLEDRLWGYIELDAGGADNKRKTRARLEALGLRPMPVYHPLNDGWAYFDELVEEGYDRMCVGNLVMASPYVRKRILRTLWERRRRHGRTIWIHALGLTPNEAAVAFPAIDSADSSSPAYALRYGAPSAPGAHAMGDSFGRFGHAMSVTLGGDAADDIGSQKGIAALTMEAASIHHVLRRVRSDLALELGEGQFSPVQEGEPEPRPEGAGA